MGLSKPFVKKVKQSRAPREHKPKLHFILSNANSSVQRIIETREAADMIKLRCAEVVPRNLTLLELGQHDCKYPYGDGPFVFCGHPKLDGSSYCQPHFSLTQGYMRTMTDAERQRRRQSYADRNRLRA